MLYPLFKRLVPQFVRAFFRDRNTAYQTLQNNYYLLQGKYQELDNRCHDLQQKISQFQNDTLPLKILNYEKLYDINTGGWFDDDPINKEQISYGSIELEVGKTLYGLIRLLKPKLILETGVYRGYSTSCVAAALKDNDNGSEEKPHIFAIDPLNLEHLWTETDLEDYITWIPQFSTDSIPLVEEKLYDVLILDSDHSYKTIMQELIKYERLLKVGGYILMHDSLYFDGVGAAVMQLYQNPRFEVVTLDSPRTHDNPRVRCPGFSIVRKISAGSPNLEYNSEFDDWNVGERESSPFLREYLLKFATEK